MKNRTSHNVLDVPATELKSKGFKVHKLGGKASPVPDYIRRDFYKVCLTHGKIRIHYADRSFEIGNSYLFFTNPHIPYAVEHLSTISGYGCLFSEAFLKIGYRIKSLQQSPLFKIGGSPVIPLNKQQSEFITTIFRKMLEEQDSSYSYKDELIRSSLHLIIHEALRLLPADNLEKHTTASKRITSIFLDLLERQFPIESPEHPLQLKTAKDFAASLSVHVNHLNRSVKTVTGKPTTAHISERVISEAKALLKHTNWNISEIAYGLGFEYTTHFNNYFKRVTGTTPKMLRE
jgi:AraC-like DNA-binding protein